jgi:TonB family protein
LIIPKDFSRLYNPEQQQLIVEHEICHFDRNDIYWNLFAYGLLALFWFHPLVWLAYFRFRQDQELSCDQTVLARKHLDSRINYGRALLVTAQHRPMLAVAHLSFNEYGDKAMMYERIKQLKPTSVVTKRPTLLLTLTVGLLLSGISYAGHIGQTGVKEAIADKRAVYPIMRVEPKYPVDAVKSHIEGAVLLKFDVSTNGDTSNISVVKASPEKVFDNAAITALAQWKYSSGHDNASKNHMVQLDFLLNETSASPAHLIERIKVSQ